MFQALKKENTVLFLTFAAMTAGFCPTSPVVHDCEYCPTSGSVWRVDAGQNSNPPDGLTWATAFEDLQQAIDAASPGDCIWVAAGRYAPTTGTDRSLSFTIDKALSLYGGFDGSEACWDYRGTNYSGTRLQGDIGVTGDNTDNSYVVVRIETPPPPFGSPPSKVVIDGFMIRDAYNDSSSHDGGGIYMNCVASLELRNCTVRNNISFGNGGGMYSNVGSFKIALSKFIANEAVNNGGALWVAQPKSDCFIHNVEFKNNTAAGNGGAFFAKNFADPLYDRWLRFANALFHGNTADYGGAGYIADCDHGGFTQLHRAQVELSYCTLSANSALTNGSALFAEESHPYPLTNQNAKFFVWANVIWGNDTSTTVIAATSSFGVGNSQVVWSVVEPVGSAWSCAPGVCFTNEPTCYNFACDPLFGTGFHLTTGSPAIDELDSTVVILPADLLDLDDDGNKTEPLPVDLDGHPRVSPSGGFIDMGCYEF